ncbi:hypothetical protein IQ235_03295 [Oscillatoriales cyanobacterium LEGE 11467]|uniref:Uncharacterized protein n=1 Tax=Zarconia navalis LEGE 11467 TaxID=1828826 RepID=A0A928Z5Z2_9CYAN|nr:hypothetical protein [Zarconia navalis LEGE 11467]
MGRIMMGYWVGVIPGALPRPAKLVWLSNDRSLFAIHDPFVLLIPSSYGLPITVSRLDRLKTCFESIQAQLEFDNQGR